VDGTSGGIGDEIKITCRWLSNWSRLLKRKLLSTMAEEVQLQQVSVKKQEVVAKKGEQQFAHCRATWMRTRRM